MGSAATKFLDAAKDGDAARLKRMIEAGDVTCDVDNDEGWTALHLACAGNHVECVDALLAGGANPLAVDSFGFTPLHRACQVDSVDCVDMLLKSSASAKQGMLNKQNDFGATPLHWAAAWGAEHCIKMLVAAGADIEKKQNNGQTPLFLACKSGSVNCVHQLLAAGASPVAQDKDGFMPYDVADGDDVRKILRFGHDEGRANRPLWTPDHASPNCSVCNVEFSLTVRRHHCRKCGGLFCDDCTRYRAKVDVLSFKHRVRLCAVCFESVGGDPSSQQQTQEDGDSDDDNIVVVVENTSSTTAPTTTTTTTPTTTSAAPVVEGPS